MQCRELQSRTAGVLASFFECFAALQAPPGLPSVANTAQKTRFNCKIFADHFWDPKSGQKRCLSNWAAPVLQNLQLVEREHCSVCSLEFSALLGCRCLALVALTCVAVCQCKNTTFVTFLAEIMHLPTVCLLPLGLWTSVMVTWSRHHRCMRLVSAENGFCHLYDATCPTVCLLSSWTLDFSVCTIAWNKTQGRPFVVCRDWDSGRLCFWAPPVVLGGSG